MWWPRTRLATDDGQPGCSGPPPQWQIDNMRTSPPKKKKVIVEDKDEGPVITLADYEDFETATESEIRVAEKRHNHRNAETACLNEKSSKPGPSALPRIFDVPESEVNTKRVDDDDDDVMIISEDEESGNRGRLTNRVVLSNVGTGERRIGSSGGSRMLNRSQRVPCLTFDLDKPEAVEPTTRGVITLEDYEDADGVPLLESLRSQRLANAISAQPEVTTNSGPSEIHDESQNGDEEVNQPIRRRQAEEVVGQTVKKATEDNNPVISGPLHIQDVPGYEDRAEDNIEGKRDNARSTRHNNSIGYPEPSDPQSSEALVDVEAEKEIDGEQHIRRSPRTTQASKATKTRRELPEPEPVEAVDISDDETYPVREIKMVNPHRSALKTTNRDANAPKTQKVLRFNKLIEVYEVPYKKKDNNGYPYIDLHVMDKRITRYYTEQELLKPPPTKKPISAQLGSPDDINLLDAELKNSVKKAFQLIKSVSGVAQKPLSASTRGPEAVILDPSNTEDKSDEEEGDDENVENNTGRRRSARQAAQKPERQPAKKKTAYKTRGKPKKAAKKPAPKKLTKKPKTPEPPQVNEASDATEDSDVENQTPKKKYNVVRQSFTRTISYRQIRGEPEKIPTRVFISRRILIPTGYNDLKTAPPKKECVQTWRILATDDELEEMEMIESYGQPRPRRPRRRFRRRVTRVVGDVITIDDTAEQPEESEQPSKLAEGTNPTVPSTSGGTEQPQGGVITLDDYDLDPPTEGSERRVIRTHGSTARTVRGVITIEDFEVVEQPGTPSDPPVHNINPDLLATTKQPYQRVITIADYETGSPPPESERGVWRRPGTSARAVGGVVTIEDYEDAEQQEASEQQPPEPAESSNPSDPDVTNDQPQPPDKPYERVITLDDFEMETPSERGQRNPTTPRLATDDGQPGTSGLSPPRSRRSKGTAKNDEPELIEVDNQAEASEKSDVVRSGDKSEKPYERVITLDDFDKPPPRRKQRNTRVSRIATDDGQPGTSGLPPLRSRLSKSPQKSGEPELIELDDESKPSSNSSDSAVTRSKLDSQKKASDQPYQRVITLDDFEKPSPRRGQQGTRAVRIATDDGQPGTSGLPPLRAKRSKYPANSGEPELIELDDESNPSSSNSEPDVLELDSQKEASDKPYERVITLDDFEKPTLRRGQRTTKASRIATDDGQPGTSGLPPVSSRRSKRPLNEDELDVIIDDDQQETSKPYKRVITMADYETDSSVPNSEERQQSDETPKVVSEDGQPGTSEPSSPHQKEPSIEVILEEVGKDQPELSEPQHEKVQTRRSVRNANKDTPQELFEQSPQATNGSNSLNEANEQPESVEKPDVITLDGSEDMERPATWKPEWPPQLARRSNPPVLDTNQDQPEATDLAEVITLEDDPPPPKTMDRIVQITRRVIKLGNEYIIIFETTFRKFRERRSERKRKTVFTLEESERGDIVMGMKVTNMDYYQRELQKYDNRLKAEQEEKEDLNWNNYYTDTPGAETFPYGLRHQPHQFPVEDLEKKKEEQEAKRRKQEEEQQEEKRTRGQRKNKRALTEEDKKPKKTPEYFQGVKYGKEFQLLEIPAYTPEVDPTEYYKNQEPMGEVMWRPEPPKKDKKQKLSFEMIYYVYWKAIWRQFEGHIPFDYALQVLMYSKYSIPDALENVDKSLKKLHQEFKPLSEGQYRKFTNFLRVRIFNRNRLQKEVLRNYYTLEVNDYFMKYKLYHKSFYNKFCRCDDRLQEPLVFTPRWCCSNCTKNMKTNILPPDQLCLICQTYTKLTGETRPARDVVFSRSDMRKIADWNILEITEHRTVTREEFEKAERKRNKYRWKRLELTEEEHDMLNMNLVPHTEEWKSNTLTLEQRKELGKFFVEQLTPHPIPLFVPCGCNEERGDRPWMIRKDKLPKKDDATPDTSVVKTVSPVVVPAPKKKKAVRGQGKGRLPPEQVLTPGAWWTLKVARSRGFARKRKA